MSASAQPINFMPVIGGFVLAAVFCYFAFFAADTYALAPSAATATVLRKEYRPARRGYTTEIIGGQTKAVPRTYPESYVVHFELSGKPAEATLSKDTFDALVAGDSIEVKYQRRRLTGALQVVGARKSGGGR